MIDSWEKEIYIAHVVKEKLQSVDVKGLWGSQCLPEVKASEEELLAMERVIGEKLDPQYREFLLRANGWKSFYQSVDLFGTAELMGGPHLERARSLLTTLEPTAPVCGIPSSELLPIAVSRDDIDLFVIARPSSLKAGKVFWFAGQLIDEFPDFCEYFLAMVDYNRREIQRLEPTQMQ